MPMPFMLMYKLARSVPGQRGYVRSHKLADCPANGRS